MAIDTIAVIGRMRGGTTVLRQFLGSSDGMFDLGEVFHGATELATNFWGFLGRLHQEDGRYLHPSSWPAAWTRFVQDQRSNLGVTKVVIDAKVEYFNFIVRSDLFTHSPFFDGPGVRYIFLRRRNLLSQTLSLARAQHTQTWSKPNRNVSQTLRDRLNYVRGQTVESDLQNFTVNPDEVLGAMTNLEAVNARIQDVFAGRISLTLDYEDLFDGDGRFSQATVDAASTVCEQHPDSFERTPVLARQNHDGVFSGIANADELRQRLLGTRFEWMLND